MTIIQDGKYPNDSFGITEEREKELQGEWSLILRHFSETFREARKEFEETHAVSDELNLNTRYILNEFVKTAKNEQEMGFAIFTAGCKTQEFLDMMPQANSLQSLLSTLKKALK